MDKERPIWKKPEGMTFEDVEELNTGEVGIVAEVVADRDQIKRSIARARAYVKAETDQDGELAEPAERVALFALLKDPAKRRAGRR